MPADPGPLEPVPLIGTDYKRDPYPLYGELRGRCPVHRVKFPSGVHAWLVTGYEAAHSALTDRRLGKDHRLGNDGWRALASIMPEPQHSQLQVHLLHQDPPVHTVMRALVLDAFAPRTVEPLRPVFQELADELVDDLVAALRTGEGPVDLIARFAARFPFAALALTIGLPPAVAARFRREWGGVVAPVGPADPGRARYEGLLRGLQDYIADVVAAVRDDLADGLLSRLVRAHDEGRLSDGQLGSTIFQLLVAGQEPVTNQISTALVTLFTHPEALARLAAEPELLPRAVEELLRYDSAFEMTTWRFFAEDTELHGRTIPAGDSVIVSLCAANRDPQRFADADELDLGRSPNPHLAFGHGIHHCVGAALARVELQVALGTLLGRLPGLRLAVDPAELTWIPAVLSRGVTALPVLADV